ncbi:MAG: hypothetical protein P0Y56_15540 [Candidatus Andeanibacterium colombiense]|uniref:Uncharacterized protein n=1 Tax=Candidatus Andeanibacterium colombiense TaxID=3121345 RepID=A0AAJ6BMU2_9SPHN|nr:MAG: hypothetical protein P0Y56_15540 [Sphingomonadaceae bacterium]
MRLLLAFTACASLLLPGCTTTLKTRPTYEVSHQKEALGGVSYSLPMLQYAVDLTYALKKCPTLAAGVPTSAFDFKIGATATSSYVAGETYTVDYRALTNIFKVTDFSIETYPSGALKAINASAEDKTGDVLKSAAEVGLAGVSMAAGNPSVALGIAKADDGGAGDIAKDLISNSTMGMPICSPPAMKALADATAARAKIKILTDDTTRDTKVIEAIAVRASNKMTRKEDRLALYNSQVAQIARQEALAAEEKTRDDADEILTFKEDRLWPEDPFMVSGGVSRSGALNAWLTPLIAYVPSNLVDPVALRKAWAEKKATLESELAKKVEAIIEAAISDQSDESREGLCAVGEQTGDCLAARVGVYGEIVPTPVAPAPCTDAKPRTALCVTANKAISARTDVEHEGLFVRQAARGRLFLCDENKACSDGDRVPLLKTQWVTAPQLGQLRFVPFHNGPFQNNALGIQLAEDGTITKLQYAEKSAILAGALASASTGVSQIESYLDEREKEKKQDIADARAEQTYQRGEVTYQRNEVTAARAEEIAAIQFEIDKTTKDQALNALLHPPAYAGSAMAKDYADETARLNAIAAQLQARLAILTAQSALDAQGK